MCFLHVLLKNECFPMRLVQFHLAIFHTFQRLRFPSISCQMYRKIMKQRWDRDSGESRDRRQRQEQRKVHIYRERHRQRREQRQGRRYPERETERTEIHTNREVER